MNIFLGECVDRRFARLLPGHTVHTAKDMGWTSIRNGELLTLAATTFDVFVTVDRNLAFQQNQPALPIPVLVLRARTNRLADLSLLAHVLLTILSRPAIQGVTFVEASKT
ncbi:MAG: hypothetical protein GC189_03270 [Alphaproteobacteria bacterium]|nr:hypothetical protein [Alphaproteobacteria bacterium]